MYDVVVIGCGIVGAATAYELSKYQLKTAVLEKENDVADQTTKANSAIIHAGYDPEPGTLMAKLNVEGSRLAKELCQKLSVHYNQVGSFVIAFNDEEAKTVEEIYERGVKNGVPELRILSGEEALKMEPNLNPKVQCALYAPTAAIVNPWEFAIALAETAVRNGVELYLNNKVVGIEKTADGYLITTDKNVYETRYIINAAGVHCDEVHNLVAEPEFRSLPNQGQYYLLDKSQGKLVNKVIFQCPTKVGKGVLVAPTVHGNLIVGPNSHFVEGYEDVSTTADGLAEVLNASLKSVPGINFRETIRNFAGIRAYIDREDFLIAESKTAKNFINLAGIKSPGLSAAPAIAKMAVDILRDLGLSATEKEGFVDTREKINFKDLPQEEKAAVIAKDARYGRVICRCETITEGEIVACLHSPIPPKTIDGVKRRCNAGMGRCQGGFCGPRVQEIISRELHIPYSEIEMDKTGSYIITGETKVGGNL
ncbi:FAD-dependent oxidoreductase [Phocea massiliensis]|uniref:NAD(P)/FAD-dependent oxidoreductase n=1 Tax=Merdimmobilis hominis TaxID=2897707 RepID=UPI001E4B4E7F|nr:NAD(P)/FAD-dependent oxidoreductase [Merdimmobilis hominis]MCD4836337.1 FAD-dependent oxidoreductase [Merdimmobilis hominis]